MKKFKEYYKTKLYEALTQDLMAEPAISEPVEPWWNPKVIDPTIQDILNTHGIDLYPGSNGLPSNITLPPGALNPNPNIDNWPPLPAGMLPTYVNPNGSMVWVLAGPPTLIYVLQLTHSGNESGLQNVQYNYSVFVSTNTNEIVGNDDHIQTWIGFEYSENGGQWVGSEPSRLNDLYPGWHNPHHPPPNILDNGNYTPWDVIPGYNDEHDHIYDPNWIDPVINPYLPDYVPRRP